MSLAGMLAPVQLLGGVLWRQRDVEEVPSHPCLGARGTKLHEQFLAGARGARELGPRSTAGPRSSLPPPATGESPEVWTMRTDI